MAHLVEIESQKTFATKANCIKAVEKLNVASKIRYIIVRDDNGRYYPVFLGSEAMYAGIHFHFPVVG